MKLTIILNKAAGRDRGDANVDEIVEIFTNAGHDVSTRLIGSGELKSALSSALLSDTEGIIVGGGDGSVECAAKVLAGSDKVLGILPLGTFNRYAQYLGLVPEQQAAAEQLSSGQVVAVDVCRVNGRPVLDNISLGLHPHAIQQRSIFDQQIHLPKRLLSLAALALAVLRSPSLELTLEEPQDSGNGDSNSLRRERIKTYFIMVATGDYNAATLTRLPQRELDGGYLTLLYSNTGSRLKVLAMGIAALFFRQAKPDGMFQRRVQQVTIQIRRRHRRIQRLKTSIGGELVRLKAPLRCRVGQQQVRMLVPADFAPERQQQGEN